MTILEPVRPAVQAEPAYYVPRSRRRRWLDEYWPLTLFFYGAPIWWLLGLWHVILFVFAIPMVWTLMRHRELRVPRGWGAYLLFLVWVAVGVAVLWVQPPGTQAKSGLGPLVGYTYRGLWYATVTIACLYVLNADRTRLTAVRIGRMLAYLFLVTVAGGMLAIAVPTLDFPSVIELFLPKGFTEQPFMNALFHPRVALMTDFLGYEQARPAAPYSYPNAWGNSFGLLAPFFVATWFGRDAGWRRWVSPLILPLAVATAAFSLNRGLWLGLGVSLAWVVVRRLLAGELKAMIASVVALIVLAAGLLVTPLGDLVSTRLDKPHSDDRRQNTVLTVLTTTWQSSPVVGFGGTRQMEGNFDSIAGGATPSCRQCAAPPLGTQGFLWGLIFTTGFVGAGLMLSFLLWQFVLNARRTTALGSLSSVVILSSGFYFLVYDSLDVPFLITMMTIGLTSRDHAQPFPADSS